MELRCICVHWIVCTIDDGNDSNGGRVFQDIALSEESAQELNKACWNHHFEAGERFRFEGDINGFNSDGNSVLIVASRKGLIHATKTLIHWPGIDINQQGKDGYTALHRACYWGHIEISEALLNCTGINVNTVNGDGDTPLITASRNGHTTIVKSLLQHADIDNINQQWNGGYTALHWACSAGHIEIAEALLNCTGISVNSVNGYGDTPLITASQSGHTTIVKSLLQHADIDNINQQGGYGMTALHWACGLVVDYGDIEIAEALLNCTGINVNTVNGNGDTPLITASQSVHTTIVKSLLQHADIDNINQEGKFDYTALHLACSEGHIEIAEALLNCTGINVNTVDVYGDTPLVTASHRGHTTIVKSLLQHVEVDINKGHPMQQVHGGGVGWIVDEIGALGMLQDDWLEDNKVCTMFGVMIELSEDEITRFEVDQDANDNDEYGNCTEIFQVGWCGLHDIGFGTLVGVCHHYIMPW